MSTDNDYVQTGYPRAFADRAAAGRELAARLSGKDLPRAVVVALPRGGVPVASEVARALKAPLDILLVRKIGVPHEPEVALAAIAEGDEPVLEVDEPVQRITGLDRGAIEALAATQWAEIERRRKRYRGHQPRQALCGATVILVDDGIATGTTIRAALRAIRQQQPARLIVAVPVAPAQIIDELRVAADDVVCLASPEPFGAVGQYYRDFHQLSDDEVIAALRASPTGLASLVP